MKEMKAMESVINQLTTKLDRTKSLAAGKERESKVEIDMLKAELKTFELKEKATVENFQKMQEDFKVQYNYMKEQLIKSEESVKLLTANLSGQRDRNEILKNELKVMRQKVPDKDKDTDSDVEALRKELHNFKKVFEDKLNKIAHVQHQSNVPPSDKAQRDKNSMYQQQQHRKENRSPQASKKQPTQPASRPHGPRSASSSSPKPKFRSRNQSQSALRKDSRPPTKQPSTSSEASQSSPPKDRTTSRKDNTLRFHSNNQETSELCPDENGRPGIDGCDALEQEKVQRIAKIRENRNRRNRKTLIFGSSVTRDIKKVAFDEQLDAGSADIHTFKTKTAKYITKYMTHHLEEDCPHTVVLAAGGNDIPRRRATERELEDIANCLIEGGE